MQAAWAEEWSGIEHLADLPGKRKLEREWECMTYWCECEGVETANEDAVRTQMDDIAAQQNAALTAGKEAEVWAHASARVSMLCAAPCLY